MAVVLVAALAVGSVLLVRARQSPAAPGPDSGQQAIVPPATTSTSASTTVPTHSPSPTADPVEAAVLQAHADENAAFLHAISIPDPNDPLLVATTTGVARSDIKKSLIIDQAQGVAARGDTKLLRPHVVSVTPTTAVVKDCEYSTLIGYYTATGQMVPGSDRYIPLYTATTSTFVLVDGNWKLTTKDGHDAQAPNDPSVCAGY